MITQDQWVMPLDIGDRVEIDIHHIGKYKGRIATMDREKTIYTAHFKVPHAGEVEAEFDTTQLVFDPFVRNYSAKIIIKQCRPVRKTHITKCECGGDKARTTHAPYCPVYKPFK